jgi:ribosomal protein L37E
MINLFRRWKPKGKMYSLRCSQCGSGFLSSYDLEAPICGKCLQKAKSLDSTIDHDKICIKCGKRGVIYGKEQCHSCYFGFEKSESLSSKWPDHPARVVIQGLMDDFEKLDYEYTISDRVVQCILKRQARQINIKNNNIGIGIEQFVVRRTLSHITLIMLRQPSHLSSNLLTIRSGGHTIVRYLIERLELKEYLYSLRRFI